MGPHHLIVFVLEVVTMPYVAAGVAFEANYNPGDHLRIGADRVLPTILVRLRRKRGARILERVVGVVCELIKRPAVEELKADQMKMNRMCILGKIYKAPDFY